MTRAQSKYEKAWRERAGHSDVPAPNDPPPPASVTIEVAGGVVRIGSVGDSEPVVRGEDVDKLLEEFNRHTNAVPGASTSPPPAFVPGPSAPAPQPVVDAVAKAIEIDPSAEAPARDRFVSATFEGSTNLVGAELDTTTGIVAVSFANGTTYRYRNFTAELMAGWKTAKSAGTWFHHNVRQRAAAHPLVDAPPSLPVK